MALLAVFLSAAVPSRAILPPSFALRSLDCALGKSDSPFLLRAATRPPRPRTPPSVIKSCSSVSKLLRLRHASRSANKKRRTRKPCNTRSPKPRGRKKEVRSFVRTLANCSGANEPPNDHTTKPPAMQKRPSRPEPPLCLSHYGIRPLVPFSSRTPLPQTKAAPPAFKIHPTATNGDSSNPATQNKCERRKSANAEDGGIPETLCSLTSKGRRNSRTPKNGDNEASPTPTKHTTT
jgi:hypothetical protein